MRGRTASLQRRLGVGMAVGVTLMWIAATVVAGYTIKHELDEAYDSALQETAQRLLPLAVADILGRGGDRRRRRVPVVREHEEYLTYLVRDRSGKVLLQSHDAKRADFPARPGAGFRQTATHRIYGEAAIRGTVYIEVAEPLEHRREAAFEAVQALYLPLLILVPLSLIGVWWYVRRSLKPVYAFRDEIEARGGDDLSPVRAATVPAEIAPVAEALNGLLERLRRTLLAERSFTSNSAHELRTPIAASLAQCQRLVAELPPGRLQDRARRMEGVLGDLSRLAEKLLQLATAEGGSVIREQGGDLMPVLRHLVDEFIAASSSSSAVMLDAGPDVRLESSLDPDAFAIMMRNLIENALKYGRPGEPVVVTVSNDGRIVVANACEPIAEGLLPRLTERFLRGVASGPGAGLGLAIVSAIVESAGGALRLRSPARGREDGFEAEIALRPTRAEGASR